MSLMKTKTISFDLREGLVLSLAINIRPVGKDNEVIATVASAPNSAPRLKLLVDPQKRLKVCVEDRAGNQICTEGIKSEEYAERFTTIFASLSPRSGNRFQLKLYVNTDEKAHADLAADFGEPVKDGVIVIGSDGDSSSEARFSLYGMAVHKQLSERDRQLILSHWTRTYLEKSENLT